jgi:PAS domain S-box-containing protein
MRALDPIVWLHQRRRWKVLALAAFLIACIALVDRLVVTNVSLGVLYLLPLLIASPLMSNWQVLILAVICAGLREQFGPSAWDADYLGRLTTGIVAFTGIGLFLGHMSQRRQMTTQVEEAGRMRRQAEAEARALLDTTPIAILTVDITGRIVSVNRAACRLLAADPKTLEGNLAGKYLPIIDGVLRTTNLATSLRTMVEGSGYSADGEAFYAHMWLSSYTTSEGPRLAAVVADASEQLRDRQEAGLRQLLRHSHILARAVSHEVRNLAAAAGVLHANLAKVPSLGGNEDFAALGRLVDALQKLASEATAPPADRGLVGVNIGTILEELRIILKPSLEESGIGLNWEVAGGLPLVRGDHHALLEVFLNLAQNSRRALQRVDVRRMTLVAYPLEDHVLVRFADSGPGVKSPDKLFQPFQTDGTDGGSTGLGLYVSRAILRTFGGELAYERTSEGSCFLVQLAAAAHRQAHYA